VDEVLLREVAELSRRIAALPRLKPVERAKQARGLVDEGKRVLSAVGDAAVEELTRHVSYREAAGLLGVEPATVNKAVTRHRRRASTQNR